jgi:DNA-binding NarL/FixJ family response regulator
MTRLLIAEDAEIVATGLRGTLEQDPANQVVDVVASVQGALDASLSTPVDVLVADIRLSDGTAFDLLQRMSVTPALSHRPACLIVSSFDLAQYVEAALHLGASGYILKTAPSTELLAAVRTVASGGWAFDPDLVSLAGRAKQLGLTPRDREIVAGILAGRSNDEIGADLDISRKTVEAHVSKLFTKFGVATRVELARRAEHEQWLEPVLSRHQVNGR